MVCYIGCQYDYAMLVLCQKYIRNTYKKCVLLIARPTVGITCILLASETELNK